MNASLSAQPCILKITQSTVQVQVQCYHIFEVLDTNGLKACVTVGKCNRLIVTRGKRNQIKFNVFVYGMTRHFIKLVPSEEQFNI